MELVTGLRRHRNKYVGQNEIIQTADLQASRDGFLDASPSQFVRLFGLPCWQKGDRILHLRLDHLRSVKVLKTLPFNQ